MEMKKSLKVLLTYMGVIMALLLFLPPLTASADSNILFVNAGASAGGNGSSWSAAFTDMQSAINAASAGDQIWVAAGTYIQGESITLKEGVAIYGGFAGSETDLSSRDYETNVCTLNGNNAYTVIYCSGLTNAAVLDGFTITDGSASYDNEGGGLYNKGGSPTLTNLTFMGNTALFGGGMYNENGSPTLSGVTFSGNYASDSGGGMYVVASDCPTLIGVTFDRNSSDIDGGGLFVSDSGISTINAVFINNTAVGRGGGIFLDNYDYGSHTQGITNATFTKNSEALYIYADTSSAVYTYITNTIMWDNTTEIFIDNKGSDDYQYYNVYHSIIAGSGGSSGWVSSYGANQGGNLDSNPLFAGSDDYTLLAGSPAIDAGTNTPYEAGGSAVAVSKDIIGNQRIVSGTVDMGAYEMAVGNISGTVTRGADAVEGATVTVNVGSATLSATTDSNGAYTLKSVPEGTDFTVTANTADGNNASVSGVSVTRDKTTTGVNISLKSVITISQISGITAPHGGETPIISITDTDQYTGTVTWTPDDSAFKQYISYTATIILTPKTGYTLTNVAEDFFTVPGAVSVSNDANSGVITAVFLAGDGLTKYNINEGSVTILVDGDYEIYGTGATTANTITESQGVKANITLRNVNIDASEAGKCAFCILGGNTYMTITGDNTLKSGGGNAGLYAGNGDLTINNDSDGTLAATGGSDGGAGIGSSIGYVSGRIIINGGTITATGGSNGAGIGSSYNGSCGSVAISGGTVTATGGSNGAGIGSGYGGDCTSVGISEGKVAATGSDNGAGIGGGMGRDGGMVTISGGTVTATGGSNGAGIGGGDRSGSGGGGGTIEIKGGTVTATGGSYGAGIGGGSWGAGGSITIESGIVKAFGKTGAGIGGGLFGTGGSITIGGGTVDAVSIEGTGAGIGGGYGGTGGSITINGGVVNATGGIGTYSGYSGAGIGCGGTGSGGTATINGGFVTANGNGYGQDIGYASSDGGQVSSFEKTIITGGSVCAVNSKVDPTPLSAASDGETEYLVTVTGLPASTDVTYSVGSNDTKIKTKTDASGHLYLWLPEDTTTTSLAITDGTTTYRASGTVTAGINSFTAAPAIDECFIATAAFGSKIQPAVVLLRQFRDKCLLTNTLGRAFVKFYYHNSPPVAKFIAQSEPLKALVRILLLPFIAIAYAVLHPLLWWLAAGLLVLLMLSRRKGKNKLVI